jgi:hypothetical protein
MACGEFGPGRLPEPQAIMDQLIANKFLPELARGGESA